MPFARLDLNSFVFLPGVANVRPWTRELQTCRPTSLRNQRLRPRRSSPSPLQPRASHSRSPLRHMMPSDLGMSAPRWLDSLPYRRDGQQFGTKRFTHARSSSFKRSKFATTFPKGGKSWSPVRRRSLFQPRSKSSRRG